MSAPPLDPESPLGDAPYLLREISRLLQHAAERVHAEAQESHRLTALARSHSERGRQLSQIGREEARAVHRSISWSLDTAHKAEHRLSGKDED